MNGNLSTETTFFGAITPETGLTGGISGAVGVPGTSYYVFFKYSAVQPTTSEEISDTPNEWIGVYSGTKTIAPLDPSEYTWYRYRGLPGPAGAPGPIGPKGDMGEAGAPGTPGADGQTGAPGPKGDPFTYADFSPEQLALLIGPQGERGPIGETGPQGAIGPKGDTGEPGPQGIQGIQGAQGIPGAAGADGAVGPQGPIGLTGEQGPQGLQGEIGPKGDKGDQGEIGPPGAPGQDGADGPQGPPGEAPFSEAPSDGKVYGRKDGAWAETAGGAGGGIADAPSDGNVYGRKNSTWDNITTLLNTRMPKVATAIPATGDLNTDATVAGFYTTAWNTINNPTTTACTVIVIPGINASSAFCQLACALSQNKLYFRTSYWSAEVLNFNPWKEISTGAGAAGADGKSAYQIWLDAGNTGTVNDFLESLIGPAGADGAKGDTGAGVPTGGSAGQVLTKSSSTDFDTTWTTPSSGGGGSSPSNDTTYNGVRVLNDVARQYFPASNGSLRILMKPGASGDTFVFGTVKGYSHTTRMSWFMEFGGLLGTTWSSLNVVLSPNCPFTAVRRGYDANTSSPCIVLGTAGGAWPFQMVTVPQVTIAYIGIANIGTAPWTMLISTDETGYTLADAENIKTLSYTE